MPSVVFVVNRALVRDPRGFGRRCLAAARNFGWEPVLAETSPGESGLGLARRAVADGAGLVFAAGGDGTVRACAQALAGTGIPLAIVPLGTANLTARALGIPARSARRSRWGSAGGTTGSTWPARSWAVRIRTAARAAAARTMA